MFEPESLPGPLPAMLVQLRALAAEPPAMPTAADRAAWLVGLRQVADAAEAAFTHALGRFDAAGDAETLHGARSTQAWLRGACGLAPGDAGSRVHVARQARTVLRDAVSALAAGHVTYPQVGQISRSLRRLPESTHVEAVDLLTELARVSDAAAVALAGRRLVEVVDPDAADAAAAAQFDRRYLHLSPLLDGMTVVDGLLDAEGAEMVATALAPFLVPLGPDDARTTAQRRADGLVELARVTCDHALLPELAGRRPHLDVMVPLAVLTGAAPAVGRCPHQAVSAPPPAWPTGSPTGLPTGPLEPEPPAGSFSLPREAVRRLACDAVVGRVLLGPDSVVLDLGRTRRLFSPQQRRALAIRDGGCRFPGCHRPAKFTDAHHIRPWTAGGASDLANAVLICRFHHRLVHEGGWRIEVVDVDRGADGPLEFAGRVGQRLHEAAGRLPGASCSRGP